MKSRSLYLTVMGCAFLLSSACAPQNKGVDLEQQIQQQDMQLRQLQPAQADTWNQLQSMRQELNTLKGQMDDLQNAGGARALVERVNRHDGALRQVETAMALNLNLGDPAPAPGHSPAPSAGYAPAPAAAFTPTPIAGSPMTGAPTALGASSQPAQPAGSYGMVPEGVQPYQGAAQQQQPVPAPDGSTWGQPSPQPQAAPAPQKDISLALFDAGVNAFNARKYEEAQRSFTDFLKNYTGHTLSADAQFYLAECYFQRNQFADAALAYDTVIKKHSKSSRLPAAYLKQGIAFSKLNQGAAAKARMQELIKKYPNAPEAARGKSFLKNNK